MYHKITLQNGLRVMLIDMPHMESVALGIWIAAGGRYENKKNSGISHYLEHMVFKGTNTRSTKDIKESIEGIGGSLNGFTDEEETCYYVKVPNKFIDLGLDVLSDMVTRPKLSVADMNKERSVIYEEIKMYKDHPDHYANQLLCELMWPGHPLGRPLVGTEESLKGLGREELDRFREKFYTPGNTVICACGQINKDVFLGLVKNHFSSSGKVPAPVFKKFLSRQKRGRFNIAKKDIEQTRLTIGFHNVSRFHPDKYTSSILHVILGGNMSSRLFHEVREAKGLAYEISTGVKHYSDTGAFVISAGLDNRKLSGALQIISRELRKIKRIRVGDDEFRRAKDFYKGQLAMGLEDTLNRMIWTGEKLITKDISYNIDEAIDSINHVTPRMVTELAGRMFRPGNMSVALVGPAGKDDQALLKSRLRL